MLDAPLAPWEQMVQVNLLGTLHCAHARSAAPARGGRDDLRAWRTWWAGPPCRTCSPRRVRPPGRGGPGGHQLAIGSPRPQGRGVYTATKQGVNPYSEALRQEVAGRQVRVAVLEPAAVATELSFRSRSGALAARRSYDRLSPADVADAVGYVAPRPGHAAVS
ncbi:SDR family NAD(P)-dependent oxidoreductase [Streptomyces sp. NPDC048415]|uniref:SDR family oxidoreductase n=1 Tax=Streptomyces sp. NPDC048415 TaxID=3154822 RepID=UPI00341F6332